MSSELSAKLQVTTWWIISIAVAVLCCSVLFVLFASYLVEMREEVRDTDARIRLVEERDDRILAELESMHKHMLAQPGFIPGSGGAAMPATPMMVVPASEPTPMPLVSASPAPMPSATPSPESVPTPDPGLMQKK